MTTLKDKELLTKGGMNIFHLQGNYFKSEDVKQHISQDNKDLDLLFMTIMTIIINNKNKTKIQGEIIAYIKKRFENFGDLEK